MKSVALLVVLAIAGASAEYRLHHLNTHPAARRTVYRSEPPPAPAYIPILSQTDHRDEKGYSYSYTTGDQTIVSERGVLKPGPEGDVIVADGSFSFLAPDGVRYTVTYKADENGFHAEGAHLPKSVEPIHPTF